MFGLGVSEILLILVVVLIVFGPTKLPDLARTFGKAMAEFRRASRDLRDTFEVEFNRMDQDTRSGKPSAQPAPRLIDAEFEEPRKVVPSTTSTSSSTAAPAPEPRPADSSPPSSAVPPTDANG